MLLGFRDPPSGPDQVELAGPVPEGSGHILVPWQLDIGPVPNRFARNGNHRKTMGNHWKTMGIKISKFDKHMFAPLCCHI